MRLLRPLLVLGAACTLVVSLSGQTVRVLSVSGEATLQAPGDSAPRVVKKGDTIVVGTKIITSEGARVILTPLPGVNSIISPKSEVVIERVSISAPDAATKTSVHSAVLDLKTGAVTTDLQHTDGVQLDYGVRTARGLAGARGTTYTVGINAAGIQTIVVADGRISLTLADGRVVDLVPGQVSITHADGGTRAVTSASDLSTGDQAIADNWVETTLDALAEAVEQGIDIDPAALEDAARAAAGLGIDIDADTQAKLDRARDRLEDRRQARRESATGGDRSDTKDAQTVVTETRQSQDTQLDDYLRALAAYLLTLSENQRAAFQSLPDDVQRLLVTANDATYTAYALDLYGEGQTRAVSVIRYAGNLPATVRSAFYERPDSTQEFLAAHPADTGLRNYALTADGENGYPSDYLLGYFQPLTSGQRSAFRALDVALRDSLAEINDPTLTKYALATGRTPAQVAYAVSLPGADLALFVTFPGNVQTLLVNGSADTALASFAYATNAGGGNLHSHAQIAFYAGLSADDRATYEARPLNLQEQAATDSAFAPLVLARDTQTSAPLYSDATLGHYLTLTGAATRADYLARSADVRDLFAQIAKPALTAAVLNEANFDEAPTDADLRRNLSAYLALSPQNQALFETFAGGATYSKLGSAPGPYDWSDAAWTRTRNSFTALPSATQTRILNLGATEGLFDRSATYIEAAFQEYDTTLSSADRTAVQSAGWGRLFADYFGNDTLRSLFADAHTFSSTEIETIRLFEISPFAFDYHGEVTAPSAQVQSVTTADRSEGADPRERLATLKSLPLADRKLLAKLLAGDDILFVSGRGYYDENDNYIYPDYGQTLANALAFANEFAADLSDLSASGLGQQLFAYPPDATIYVGDAPTTARDRLAYLLGLYRGLSPERRDLARDLGLFDSIYFESAAFDASSLGGTLDTLAALSANTRDYLATAADDVSVFDLVNGGSDYGYYSLSEIDGLLSALTPAEFATLRELNPGSTLVRGSTYNGGLLSVSELKSFLGYVASLGDLQRFTLNELGITGDNNERKGLFLSDHEGLGRLLQAYSELPAKLRVETRQLNPYEASYKTYSGRSFFFASDDGYTPTPGYEYLTTNVAFESPDDLHVGATRLLSITGYLANAGLSASPATFTVGGDRAHDIYLRASSLVDLNSVSFSANVRAITIEAATINLANLDFPEGSVVALNSKLGGMGTGNRYPNFDGTSMPGRVNFLYNVSYGGAQMFDEPSFDSASRGNIVFGTLQNPALRPAYTPPNNVIVPTNPQ